MMHIKEVIEKMKTDLSYKVVLTGDGLKRKADINGHGSIVTFALADTLGTVIGKSVKPEHFETVFKDVEEVIRKNAEKEMAKR